MRLFSILSTANTFTLFKMLLGVLRRIVDITLSEPWRSTNVSIFLDILSLKVIYATALCTFSVLTTPQVDKRVILRLGKDNSPRSSLKVTPLLGSSVFKNLIFFGKNEI